jgi:hypothetical protein
VPRAPEGFVPPEEIPEPVAEGGGGMTLVASVPPDPPVALRPPPEALPEKTLGGGGTTSCVPKIFPMTLLTNDVLPVCAGGGGTTVGDTAPLPPLSSRRKSRVVSADGGGVITEGAGRLSFASCVPSRSGADTGGGTTAALFMRTRDGESSRPAAVGTGGTMLPLSAGVRRELSREILVEAGSMTRAFKDGAPRVRSRETLGAGATT